MDQGSNRRPFGSIFLDKHIENQGVIDGQMSRASYLWGHYIYLIDILGRYIYLDILFLIEPGVSFQGSSRGARQLVHAYVVCFYFFLIVVVPIPDQTGPFIDFYIRSDMFLHRFLIKYQFSISKTLLF